MSKTAGTSGPATAPVYLVGGGPEIWSMSPADRLVKMFARLGITEVSRWDGTAPSGGPCYVVSAAHAFAQVLLADLSRTVGTVLTSNGQPVAAFVSAARVPDVVADIDTGILSKAADLKPCEPEELSSAYDQVLRKREVPYVMPVSPENVEAIEQRIFDGSYKGVTDFVTLYLWPRPAIAVTRWCARLGITPNTVTTISLVLVLLAMWLFWNGYFGIGLIIAWLMTFLDTVDGKLARVTVTSTKLGNVYDHGIDLIHPPFWYWAWAVGVAATVPDAPDLTLALWVTVIGYVVQRLQEGFFIKVFGIEMHIWRRFDSIYRLWVARRNPNLALLTVFTLAGFPAEGLMAVALWTAVSLLVHSIQIAQALRAERPLQSWLDR